jgi:hypothetical protein
VNFNQKSYTIRLNAKDRKFYNYADDIMRLKLTLIKPSVNEIFSFSYVFERFIMFLCFLGE